VSADFLSRCTDAEEVAPIAGYTTTDPKALDALTCAIRSDADALDRYKRATVRWPLKGWRRKVCPTTPEAEWDQVAMQKILDSPAIASREQQRCVDYHSRERMARLCPTRRVADPASLCVHSIC
jgi:hypothetical protein